MTESKRCGGRELIGVGGAAAVGGGSRRGQHKRAILGLVVVGSGEIDARAPLQRSEERRRDAGPDPARHPVQLLALDGSAAVLRRRLIRRHFLSLSPIPKDIESNLWGVRRGIKNERKVENSRQLFCPNGRWWGITPNIIRQVTSKANYVIRIKYQALGPTFSLKLYPY